MIFLGDTHGNFNYVKWYIDQRKIRDNQIIHVGDYGVGFLDTEFKERNQMGIFNKWLRERGLVMHVFRGNHDNPNYFNGEFMYTNLKFHPDYTILEIEGKRLLGVGGALSIDRVPRRKANLEAARYNRTQRFYWADEKFVLDEEKTRAFRDIDIVVTHTAPEFVYPVNGGKTWPYIVKQFIDQGDPDLGKDLMEERATVTEFYRILKKNNDNITHWFYGHFHTDKMEVIGNITFKLLNINELYELEDRYKDLENEDDLEKKYGEDE